ncbi:MAG: hypothetical protein A2268_09495 [Candidatus Raymondbacteria bacterium RifOxyA12_full_50_37]|uniref:Pseudouridine synthase n=1 Tax=Candidatus Raymondbacteria bacterium RIFOXYD12_FULL_49_13 TaxID=1817890 RepID=A0A1F7F1F9_UNCRA|nr:MAG: hypothetical protein A2268_09495 [Candidatus Raymondbacteria bacterium RifOxyA12_full_50_37]OGJ93125.1 MAG: hypothetical protein A2350_17685 [Candidatus Raymondbacteria bacterium RifOxyB12_full_50_8]OGJ93926.1 MAG: hypothetical protein A2248_06800 [Candidatus Raymondbacteria bacterium RIFOXYA2_FULL_49_16]OGJ94724.1 MAG: hypothetical protein A2487_07985 [Candidatus Raymondbacteria bacterium RifOxyC12_full_50_8]OGJ98205.1 MAG: hypothetical protein A2453_00365 [Candidatus Raymondbacteria b
MKEVRLNRFLASCGLGARRQCERFIVHGLVQINGQTVTELATKVDPETDSVTLRGKDLKPITSSIHLILNKPAGYVVSCKGFGEKTVFDLLKGMPATLRYAGRLDKESEGLLFFSTNGELVNMLTHPRYNMGKIYLVTLDRTLNRKELDIFRKGVPLDDELTMPAQIDPLSDTQQCYRVIIHEGKNRQIRRMMQYIGSQVLRLQRVAFGPLHLGNLPTGAFRKLNKNEIYKLKRNLNLACL